MKKKETIIGLWTTDLKGLSTQRYKKNFLGMSLFFYFLIVIEAFFFYNNFVIWFITLLALLSAGIAEFALAQNPSIEIFFPQGIILGGLTFSKIYFDFLNSSSTTIAFNIGSINVIDTIIGLVFISRLIILIIFYDLSRSDQKIFRPNSDSPVSVNKFREHELLFLEFSKKIDEDRINATSNNLLFVLRTTFVFFTFLVFLVLLGLVIEIFRNFLVTNNWIIISTAYYPFLVLILVIFLSITFLFTQFSIKGENN